MELLVGSNAEARARPWPDTEPNEGPSAAVQACLTTGTLAAQTSAAGAAAAPADAAAADQACGDT